MKLKKSVEGANGNYYVRFMVDVNAGVGNLSSWEIKKVG